MGLKLVSHLPEYFSLVSPHNGEGDETDIFVEIIRPYSKYPTLDVEWFRIVQPDTPDFELYDPIPDLYKDWNEDQRARLKFDWMFAPFEVPIWQVEIQEDRSGSACHLVLIVYVPEEKDPKQLCLWGNQIIATEVV